MSIDNSVNSVVASNDEIDLLQLWQILERRKVVVFVCAMLCVVAGAAFTFFKAESFKYSTTIMLGYISGEKTESGDKTESLVSPEQGLAMLNETFIPMSREFLQKKYNKNPPEIKATVPKNSQVIVLTSQGRLEDDGRIRDGHTVVVEGIRKETQQKIDAARKGQELQIANARLKLKELEDPRIFKHNEKNFFIKLNEAQSQMAAIVDQEKYQDLREQQLTNTQNLLNKEIEESQKRLAGAYKAQPAAVSEAGDEAKAMTMLMINNQIQNENNRLSDLKERLEIGIEEKRNQLMRDRENLKRSKQIKALEIDKLKSDLEKFKIDLGMTQERQRNLIAAVENKLKDIRETRALNIATRSLQPVGPGKAVILLLAAVVGIMGGVILAFFVEFVKSARRRSPAEVIWSSRQVAEIPRNSAQ